MLIEVVLTATDGQTITSHHDTYCPLRIRWEQNLQKYSNAAQTLGYRLVPCIFSYAGQIHYVIEGFVREQIRLKLQIADGQEDSTKLAKSDSQTLVTTNVRSYQ